MVRIVILICVASALAGCASGKSRIEAALPDMPDGWTALETEGAPPGNWLAGFGDPFLTEIAREALAHNNDIGAAAARLQAARATADRAGAARLPSADLEPGAIYSNTFVETGPGSTVRVDGTTLSLGLQTSWEVDIWGRLTDRTRGAAADADAAAWDLAALRLSIAGAVAQAWFGLVEARMLTDLAERDLENKERSLRLIFRRYRRGLSSSLDVRLARSERAARQAALEQRRFQQSAAARRLEVLLGRYPGAEIEAAARLPALPPLAGAGIPSEVLVRRPDLLAAERRLAAAGFRVRAARKALLPRLTLTGTLDTGGPDFEDLLDPKNLAANVIGGLLQPVFRGGALRADIRIERAQAEAALYDYAAAALTAFQEVEDALTAEASLASQAEARKIAFEEAVEAEKLAERQYTSGVANIFNLLDAQARRFSAEITYISIRAERLANRVRLYLALGAPHLPGAPEGGVRAAYRLEGGGQ